MLGQKHGQLVGVLEPGGPPCAPRPPPHYNATKAALSTFLETLRIDLDPSGILVTDVQPGFVDDTDDGAEQVPDAVHVGRAEGRALHRESAGARPAHHRVPAADRFLTRVAKHLPYALHAWATRSLAGQR